MSKLVQVMRALRSMPPLPDVGSRVLAIVRNPEYSIDALVALVRTDAALTTRILKLCNSSLFGVAQPITTISDAVAYLGARNLVKLVLVSCTASYFKNLPANAWVDPAMLWRQTLACASACQALAELCGHGQAAAAFTTGILHNVGRIAMVQVIDAETLATAAKQLADPKAVPVEVERRVLSLDHATASGIVTESWHLPLELRRAVRNHHDTAQMLADGGLTALLHVADELVMGMGIGDPQPDRHHAPEPQALQRLGLTGVDLAPVRAAVIQDLERIGGALNPEAPVGR